MPAEQTDNVTLPLKDLIFDILGDHQNGLSCAQVTSTTAMVLEHKLKHSQLWCIERTNVDGSDMFLPMLWRKADWRSASSTHHKQKAYSAARVLEHNLLQANVKMLAKAIMKKSPIPESAAHNMAYMMVKNPQAGTVIAFFGVLKLKTKEEDL